MEAVDSRPFAVRNGSPSRVGGKEDVFLPSLSARHKNGPSSPLPSNPCNLSFQLRIFRLTESRLEIVQYYLQGQFDAVFAEYRFSCREAPVLVILIRGGASAAVAVVGARIPATIDPGSNRTFRPT
jgi:hypothetical protein